MKSYTDKKQFENNFLDANGTIVSNCTTITEKFNNYFTNNAYFTNKILYKKTIWLPDR